MRTAVVLGLTGSIGTTALRGAAKYKDELLLTGASVHSRWVQGISLCVKHGIKNLCITSKPVLEKLRSEYPANGAAGATHRTADGNRRFSEADVFEINGILIWKNLSEMLCALQPDVVLNGISGSAGLEASITVMDSAAAYGTTDGTAEGNKKEKFTDLALANKESVVLGSRLLFEYAKAHCTRIIPVDSEHSAIDELLSAHGRQNTLRLILTASGGPFLNTPPAELERISPETAARHPTWNMGPKISIDSSTLANKGLEVMEAHYLFGFDADSIEVVIHPQSIVHSMILARSGQIYAQLSPPDMAFPIMRALLDRNFPKPAGDILDFSALDLNFQKLNEQQFPFVPDAFECIRRGGIYPVVYNTADEIAVSAFMESRIRYTQIHSTVRRALEMDWNMPLTDIHDIPLLQREITERVLKCI